MAPAFVQKNDGTLFGSGNHLSTTLAYSSNNTLGNLLVAVVSWFNQSTSGPNAVAVTVTDSAGNTWQSIPTRFSSTNGAEALQFWYALNCKAGANTVTFSFNDGSGGGASFAGAFIGEWSGVNAFDNYDIQAAGSASHSTGTGTNVQSTNGTTAGSSQTAATHDSTELVISYAHNTAYNTWSVSSPWTLRSRVGNGSTDFQIGVADQNVANGSYAGQFTMGSSAAWCIGTTTFYQTDSTAFVQEADHNDGQSSTSTTDTFSFNMPNTGGNTLFLNYVWLGQTANVTITSITDTAGNTGWTLLPRQTINSSTTAPYPTYAQAAYCLNCKSGANTVTVNFSGSGAAYTGASISEWLASAAASFDTYAQQVITSASPSSPSITTATNGELLIGYGSTQDGFVTVTPSSGWTTRTCNFRSVSLQSMFNQPQGTYSNSFTSVPQGGSSGNTNLWAIGIAAFKPTGGGGGGGSSGSPSTSIDYGPATNTPTLVSGLGCGIEVHIGNPPSYITNSALNGTGVNPLAPAATVAQPPLVAHPTATNAVRSVKASGPWGTLINPA